jgi:hypothetical protein
MIFLGKQIDNNWEKNSKNKIKKIAKFLNMAKSNK